MRTITRLSHAVGDRILNRLVPAATAGACCDLFGKCNWTTDGCGCSGGYQYMREVCVTCDCKLRYSACYRTSAFC
ncbi:hypothetical protein LX16_0480 [Stackebrandtia albiflava]|uniref:Uncharacterized protein n=1 Tax=Stackebrandtia albiflava TaxID=406432 RepID=A0A562VA66_9ACTN|nr:hypothetical protein [Stackebrandtia albiflava]TWJ14790.1 hypothetical protein LX16_0480 [Stackebrandtia albiflava]